MENRKLIFFIFRGVLNSKKRIDKILFAKRINNFLLVGSKKTTAFPV
jgi:hypothetical protein